MTNLISFEELCDFVESELSRNPNRQFGKTFKKEPYKSSLEKIFPMISSDPFRAMPYITLLKSRQKTPPKCSLDGCDNYVPYGNKSFNQCCSKSCAGTFTNSKPEIREKIKNTFLEKYGTTNPMKNKDIQEKTKKTNMERYGAEYPLDNPDIKEKAIQTNLERYGHENPFGSPEIQEKIKQSNLERYGAEYPLDNPDIKEKATQTNLERYGSVSPFANDEIRNKIKKTNLEKYGHENPFGSPEIQARRNHTNLERYGNKNPLGNKKVQEKYKQNCREKYGYENPMQSPIIQEKTKKTNMERYGRESPFGNEEIKEKIRQTNRKKYGTEYPFGNEDVQDKIKQTNLERYGCESSWGNPDVRETTKQTNRKRYGVEYPHQAHLKNIHILQNPILLEHAINEYRPVGVAELCNCDPTTVRKYAQEYNITLPTFANSYWENELAKYLDDLNITYELNTRKIIAPYELDFYLLDHNIAIELNGTYWHSETNKGKTYHYDKWKLCQDQGIQLIQIWDTDWERTKYIWKSKLQYMTGKISNQIYARKCSIENISAKNAKKFYDENHLQGFTGASLHLGLIYEDIPLSMMSFGKTRATKSNEFELVRFCSKLGYNVTGAASKLLKCYQRSNYNTKIISFSDNMYSDGKLYETLGFTKAHELKPDYSYMKNNQRYHKQTFTKSSIQKKFGLSDEDISTKTEFQLMDELGYVRIWDAGKIKWVLNP